MLYNEDVICSAGLCLQRMSPILGTFITFVIDRFVAKYGVTNCSFFFGEENFEFILENVAKLKMKNFSWAMIGAICATNVYPKNAYFGVD